MIEKKLNIIFFPLIDSWKVKTGFIDRYGYCNLENVLTGKILLSSKYNRCNAILMKSSRCFHGAFYIGAGCTLNKKTLKFLLFWQLDFWHSDFAWFSTDIKRTEIASWPVLQDMVNIWHFTTSLYIILSVTSCHVA